MKGKFSIVLTVCTAMFGSACALSPQNMIVGNWEVEGTPMKMTAQFNKDGSAKITMMGHTLQGAYQFNGGNELEWSMNGMKTKAKVNVTATELELTDDQNRTIKYKRK